MHSTYYMKVLLTNKNTAMPASASSNSSLETAPYGPVVKELDISIEPGIQMLCLGIPNKECQINQLPIPKTAECLIAVYSQEQMAGGSAMNKVALSALKPEAGSNKNMRLISTANRVFVFLLSKQWLAHYGSNLGFDAFNGQLQALHGALVLNASFQEETTHLLNHAHLSKVSHLQWNYFTFQTLKAFFQIQKSITGSGRPKTSNEDIAQNAIHFMEQHIEESIISIDQIADHCGVSSSKLKNLFKATTSQSVYRYYLNLRLDYAAELLQNTRLNVSEVAFRVGYSNISKFSEMFKKRYGKLPSELRKVAN